MSWLFYALIGVVGSSFASVMRRALMKDDKADAYASAIAFQFLGFIMILLFSLLNGFSLPPIQTYWLNYLAQAFLWGLVTVFLFKANKYLEASQVTIIYSFASIVGIVSAVLFLNDNLTVTRVWGTVLIIFSVILVFWQKGKVELNRGFGYMLAVCLCSGVAVTNDAFLLRTTDVFSMLTIGWLTPGLFLLIAHPKAVVRLKYYWHKKHFNSLFWFTLLYALSGAAFYLAIKAGGQVSQVSPISNASIILTVLLSALFLNERNNLLKKLIAAVLVMIGVMLLS
ncbi:hypothetical protein A2313_01710 [Candidatus Roizmanbacteria bacterium RIFOXYB2_FULL_41_10]|uniref:EamA domain-containing protein n=1 Tax=Candidatus Roizmanbacteria bacterium RIFOXYA1_FULL_41_12 TaxID=1802082 RepID=A0A1F7KGN6_9BACT|nr:MAG: hypothetical protein A2262_01850 [Candidatus Roizmanbacteria bacterium RIFOXYA2_FULL_41_8]OGK67025.1 MAG: hypothetical protein A2209_03150 [Candidatus Roizmanbacteria bacterium RIFOXYA1_FULL_41_12]OGK71083.1 MAG: hypothetical protein A2313_01710 [Candidatus Roizmanbacteria bacterium RIFOXYB2_FULL_41_10]OGK71681.1 MAG: hypothetical protein A2403_04445 [Candidatus Roizmanbacteria bacterium RIFOXYC1_FULL_41_16]OGK75025.1 MAG: hypothetical protein A2575_03830 [Candidatus Roizmanbacteria bac